MESLPKFRRLYISLAICDFSSIQGMTTISLQLTIGKTMLNYKVLFKEMFFINVDYQNEIKSAS